MTEPKAARDGAFISYARADGEAVARELHARLRKDAPEIPAWLDRFEIEGGVGWWIQIERELDRAEFLILIMTPAAMRSENTRAEWRSARQRGVCVYPIKGAPDAELDYPSLPNWMRKAHFYDPALEWEKLLAHLRRGCRATRVPFMAPQLPHAFVGRESEVNAAVDLIRQRTHSGAATAITLRGPGGFGKTTIATAIAHDERIIDAFDDGILWVTLGQQPNLLNMLAKLYAALTGERPGFVDVDDASRELALVLEHKSCLIVLDDVWSPTHLRPFLRDAPGCARLITSRSLDVATGLGRVDINRMRSTDASRLLSTYSGLQHLDESSLLALVARLGEWPLAIKLAGRAMRRRIERGDSADGALRYLSLALEKRGITAFDMNEATEREDAVARTVGASLDLLPPDAQRRCVELSVFREVQAVPISTIALLWGLDDLDAEDLARTLDDLGLVEFDLGRGTLRLHAVLHEFFASRVANMMDVHARIVDAWQNVYALPDGYAWRSLAFHLHGARRLSELRRLLLDFRWLERKLAATDIHLLLDDFETAADDPVLALLRDALKLSAPALATDSRQLATQLLARARLRSEPEIVALLETARSSAPTPWLDLIHPTLDAPGGMLASTLVGHTREVLALAADSTHSFVVSGSSDGTLRQWNTRDGQATQILARPTLGVRAVALSSDGRTALAGDANGYITVWDLENGHALGRFSREAGRAVTSVAISADASVAVSASRDRMVRVWDVASRRTVRILAGHEDDVSSVAVSNDGRRAVSGADDGTVRVWNVENGNLERTLFGHSGPVNAVAMSGDGCHALSASDDRTLRVWALETGECVRTLHGHESAVTAVALAAPASMALSGSSDGTLRLWDLRTGETLGRVRGHTDEVTAVTIDATGEAAASASVDRTIKLWKPAQRSADAMFDAHHGAVRSLVFNDEGSVCASGGEDGHILIREVTSGRVRQNLVSGRGIVRSLAFSRDNELVLSHSDDSGARLWTIDAGEGVWIPVRHLAPIDGYALSPSARYLVTSCSDRFIYLWDVPAGALLERYGTRRLFDHLIEASPRRRLGGPRLPKWQRLVDEDYWADRYLDDEPLYEVAAVETSHDGSWIALSAVRRERGSTRDQLRQGDPGRSACLAAFNFTTHEVWSVEPAQAEAITTFAVAGDGNRLLYARADRAIELWEKNAIAPTRVFVGHNDTVNAVTFFPQRRLIASGGRDHSVRIWDLESGVELARFTLDAAVRAVAVAPDGVIAAGDVAGRVHMFRLRESRH
jgi:WD40 repeat protein